MQANYPFYPTHFTLAFRQGGVNRKWGLWFSLGANDFLVNPEVLAKTLAEGGVRGYRKEWNLNGETITLGVEKEA